MLDAAMEIFWDDSSGGQVLKLSNVIFIFFLLVVCILVCFLGNFVVGYCLVQTQKPGRFCVCVCVRVISGLLFILLVIVSLFG
jgi:hypothetical protein